MSQTIDYSSLLQESGSEGNNWKDIYDENLPLSLNLVRILKQSVFLPHDFYNLVAAYFLLPSALCRVVPYLFLFGQSGSGKTTLAKVASVLHNVSFNSSSDTFAAIRNNLNEVRYGWTEVQDKNSPTGTYNKRTERNTCMVWDDINSHVFTSNPNLYNIFKFGYDRKTDKIIISSDKIGENLEFHCFCPKVFSSIAPLHLDESLKELRRRLIVIPCKRVEELSDERKVELGIDDDTWQSKLLDIDFYDWKGFDKEYCDFWDISQAQVFISTRNVLAKTVKGLSSQHRGISLDILACGISGGIWEDEAEALGEIKAYWSWFKQETERFAGLTGLLKGYVATERRNSKYANGQAQIHTSELRAQVDAWFNQGWLYDRPTSKEVKTAMFDLGMRLHKGVWTNG